MTWNYRVIAFTHDDAGRILETTFYAIHEVHYDKTGTPRFYSLEAARIGWDADEPDAPYSILDRMREALSKPVLDSSIF